MDGMKTTNVSNKSLFLGDNLFETSAISLNAGQTIACGAVLRRKGDEFTPAINGDELSAVNPVEIVNDSDSEKMYSLRALISGKVREDMVSIDGQSLTATDRDALRKMGIIAISVTDVSQLDNQ